MPLRDGYAQGHPCWTDLISTDPDAVRTFYAGLFGWDWGDPNLPGGGQYWTARLDGAAVAGMPGGPPSGRSMWLTYVAVDDVDAMTAKAVEAGASVAAEPLDVGPAGRRSFITDPTGAMLGLWQAGNHPGAGVTAEPGAMIWNEVYTPEPSAAAEFYGGLFGWAVGSMTMPDGTDYTTFSVGETMIGGTAEVPRPEDGPHWHVWFGTSNVAATTEAVRALGGTVTMEPTDFNGGGYASFRDPAGAAFSVITPGG